MFLALVFRPPFQHGAILQKLRSETQNYQKIMKISKQIFIETNPQPRTAKRLRLERVKPLKLTTIATLSAVCTNAQSPQSRAKKEAGIKASGTHNHQKSEERAPSKAIKNKTMKSWSKSPFCAKKWITCLRLLGPFLSLGPLWDQNGPQVSPESQAPHLVG